MSGFVTVPASVFTDETGIATRIPVVMTPAGVLEPLLDYLLKRFHDRSAMWRTKVCRAVTLFCEYIHANPNERDYTVLFQNFAQRLYSGSIDRTTGFDSSQLYWAPKSFDDAEEIIVYLRDFFDHLGTLRPEAAKLNPRYAGNSFDRATDRAAYEFKRNKAFLGHIWSPTAPESGHTTRAARGPKKQVENPPEFPESRFEELLYEGFKVSGQHDYRGMLITLLLNGAGFRVSEPFHLYIGDVHVNPLDDESATVLIHHPQVGLAPRDWKDGLGRPAKGTRKQYLADRWGLLPRNEMWGKLHSGWKAGIAEGADLGEKYLNAYWFGPWMGKVYLEIWHRYMHQVARTKRDHPFAFVNLSRGTVGAPYRLGRYLEAHTAACMRIGLTVAKELGTTPHGHRHAYAQRLRRAGVKGEFIMRFMHHSSMESQLVYTAVSKKEAELEITKAAQRLASLTESNSGRARFPSR